jgi:very-short-patch-repair endonuclease
MSFIETKMCSSCKEQKDVNDFYDRKHSNGLVKKQGQCKICLQKVKQARRNVIKDLDNEKRRNRKKKCLDCDELIQRKSRTLRCHSCANKKRWLDDGEERKIKFAETMKNVWSNKEHRNKISQQMKQRRNSYEFKQKLASSSKNGRLSKLHRKIKQTLRLEEIGFLSEQVIDKFFVDELNLNKKIIIEINGDYIHANPKSFKPNDVIKILGKRYTAQEKWDYDKQRKDFLESLGYNVLVIWESDDLDQHKEKINNLLYEVK